MLCHCNSGKFYINCCKILHEGAYPYNALSLMRSRYCAYAHHLAEYIIRTTHVNPHYNPDHSQWTQEILHFCQTTKFQKLVIIDFIDGAVEAYVTFQAHLIQDNVPIILKEKSHFKIVGKQWLYLDGILDF